MWGIFPPRLREQSASRALLQNLHDNRGSSDLSFRDEQMNVFGHHQVSHDDESVALADLFENRKEAFAATLSAQKR